MAEHRSVYLAGPDVFFPEAEAWAERKKAICARYGLRGVSPLDRLADEPAVWAGFPDWRRIGLRNEAHIRRSDGLIANVTPFRGPSADVGTVFEVGFARALGLPVFGYATRAAAFVPRTLAAMGDTATTAPDGSCRDGDGLLIEQFGLFDNLMIETAILDSGGLLVVEECGPVDRWRDLSVFERCVQAVAASLDFADRPGCR